MDPRELALLVTAVANGLYGCLPARELAVLAAVCMAILAKRGPAMLKAL